MQYEIVQFVGPFTPGQSVSSDAFPEGTDFDRLVRLGAVRPAAGQAPPDPPKVVTLKRQLLAAQSLAATLQGELDMANARITELVAPPG